MTVPADVIVKDYPDGRDLYRRASVFDNATPTNCGPYDVGSIHVPEHGWFQQWTDRTNCPLVVKRTPAEIVAANRSFQFGDTGCAVNAVANYTFTGPMNNAGVTKFMGQSGERPEIGWVTDPTGQFMLGGSPGPMLAQALAHDSVPINYIDINTGKPIDLTVYPQGNTYDGNQGQPRWDKGVGIPPDNYYHDYADGWVPDTGHYPSLSFMAFQATKDPGLLYNLQHAGNFPTISDAANCSPTKGAVINQLQTRQVAWGLRNIFEAHIATKDAEAWGILPSDLHPSSYFKKLLDNNLAFYGAQITDPARQTFRVIGPLLRFGPWQCDYLQTVLSFAVLTGHMDWVPVYLWCLGNQVARTANIHGQYPPGYGTAYYLNSVPYKTDANGNPIVGDWDTSAPQFDWKQAFLYQQIDPQSGGLTQAQVDKLAIDPLNGGKAMQGNEYNMTTMAALTMADYLDKKGVASVRAQYPLDTCLANMRAMFLAYGKVNARVSVISSGGIIMPSAVTIITGQKVQLNVSFVGPNPPNPPVYTQTDATVGGLSNGGMAGVLFTSLKAGKSTVTATAQGASGNISASCEVTVNPPLPTGITLTPGTIS